MTDHHECNYPLLKELLPVEGVNRVTGVPILKAKFNNPTDLEKNLVVQDCLFVISPSSWKIYAAQMVKIFLPYDLYLPLGIRDKHIE